LGISPFFGAKYSLNKRFSVSAQVGADVAYSIQNAVESKSGQKITRNSTVFDFSQNSGILNDISLIYKF
jgi:hypothetical protein